MLDICERAFEGRIFPGFRSSQRGFSARTGVLRNFEKFTGKHLCQSLFLIKLACNFVMKEALAQVFSCEFCEISKNTFFTEHLWETASDVTSLMFPRKFGLVKTAI